MYVFTSKPASAPCLNPTNSDTDTLKPAPTPTQSVLQVVESRVLLSYAVDGCVKLLWLELLRLSINVEELLFLLMLRLHSCRDFKYCEEQQRNRRRRSWKR